MYDDAQDALINELSLQNFLKIKEIPYVFAHMVMLKDINVLHPVNKAYFSEIDMNHFAHTPWEDTIIKFDKFPKEKNGHPSETAHAAIANQFIKAIDRLYKIN